FSECSGYCMQISTSTSQPYNIAHNNFTNGAVGLQVVGSTNVDVDATAGIYQNTFSGFREAAISWTQFTYRQAIVHNNVFASNAVALDQLAADATNNLFYNNVKAINQGRRSGIQVYRNRFQANHIGLFRFWNYVTGLTVLENDFCENKAWSIFESSFS